MKPNELIQAKILTPAQLQRRLNLWRHYQKRIVFTNGCFDILHSGHVHLLAQAAAFGDILIVGLNADSSVKKLKGDNRPLQNEATRASVLASLFYVQAVVLFETETPLELIKIITPDVLVKGGDYTAENIVGAEWVLQHGGKVEIIPLLAGFSTTGVEEKMVKGKQ